LIIGAVLGLILAAWGPARTQTCAGLATDGTLADLGSGQRVFAVNLQSGRAIWEFPPQGYTGNAGVFAADPGVEAGMLVVGSEGPAGSYSGVLYGLDAATGQRQWCLAFDQKGADRETCPLAEGGTQAGFLGLSRAVDNRILGGVTVTDGVAYVGLASGGVYAVDAGTGQALWRFDAERDVWGAPRWANGSVYVASLDHKLYAIDAETGVKRWDRDLGAALAGTPSVSTDGETLYVGTFGSKLLALDAATGEQRWEKATTNWVWSGPALDNGVLYFTDVAGMVYAVAADTGQNVWTPFMPGGQMRGRPALTADLFYVGDREGNLFAVDRATGAVRHRTTLDGQVLAAPMIGGGRVLVAPFGGDNLLAGYSMDLALVQFAFAP
jgi:outer membrane protein assembly factor BamB